MEREWKETRARDYLSQWFFTLDPTIAEDQYQTIRCIGASDGILCAAFWGGYQRLQPGSASGGQSVESSHVNDWRGAFVDAEGNTLSSLTPDKAFPQLAEVIRMQSRQEAKAKKEGVALPDVPWDADRCARNSTMLQKDGRSTSVQFAERPELTHEVRLSDSTHVHVMPRTLMCLERRTAQDDPTRTEHVWSPAATEDLQMTAAQARLRAEAAMCHDGQQLLQHWRDGGAVVGARASSYKLVPEALA